MRARLDLARPLGTLVPEERDILLPVVCIVVDIDLGIYRPYFPVGTLNEWIDLGERGVGAHEGLV